jgi:hypothetical protein
MKIALAAKTIMQPTKTSARTAVIPNQTKPDEERLFESITTILLYTSPNSVFIVRNIRCSEK